MSETRLFEVAEIEIQDVRVTVFFLPDDLAPQTPGETRSLEAELRLHLQGSTECAGRAQIQGEFVIVWKDSGTKRLICGAALRPFFESIRYDQLYAQRNRVIECGC